VKRGPGLGDPRVERPAERRRVEEGRPPALSEPRRQGGRAECQPAEAPSRLLKKQLWGIDRGSRV
jgi:hypothetical protein